MIQAAKFIVAPQFARIPGKKYFTAERVRTGTNDITPAANIRLNKITNDLQIEKLLHLFTFAGWKWKNYE